VVLIDGFLRALRGKERSIRRLVQRVGEDRSPLILIFLILESATPAQRRVLFATAIREDEETSTDSFIRFAGFRNNSSVGAAMRPFLKGNNAIF